MLDVNNMFVYQYMPFQSLEGIHTIEYLTSYLVFKYPSDWQSLLKDYRFYGNSTKTNNHVFKFKGFLNIIDENDSYIDIPFS